MMWGMTVRRTITSVTVAVLTVAPACTNDERNYPAAPARQRMDALGQMEVALDGGYTRKEIRRKLDIGLTLYELPLTEDNYSRAGSTLVALSSELGVSEMAILDHTICSHVPGVAITFPEAAALSASFVATGDQCR